VFNSAQQKSSLENAINALQGIYVSGGFHYSEGANGMSGPLLQQEYERVTAGDQNTTNSVSLHWQPRPWLPIDATGGLNSMQRTDVSYVPFGIYDGAVDINSVGAQQAVEQSDTLGYYGFGRGSSRDQTLDFGTAIPLAQQRVKVSLGGNVHSGSTSDFSVYSDQMKPGVSVPEEFLTRCDKIYDLNKPLVCPSPNRLETSGQSTYGWYLEPRLNIASRFFVAPGFRLDGGSGGSKGSSVDGLSAFPKMDFSYVAVNREGERPLWGFLSLFRPRLAFGLAGTQPGPDVKLRYYNVGGGRSINVLGGSFGYNTGDSLGLTGCGYGLVTLDGGASEVPGACLSALGNSRLRPERSSEVEDGFDASLWHDRLSVTYTSYNKTRRDAILAVNVAPSVFSLGSDGSQIEQNIGVIRNTGTEVTINATLVERRAFGWAIGANLSGDQNLVVRLNKGQLPIISHAGGLEEETRVQAGYPLFAIFARPITGYADVNGDGIIEQDEVSVGDSSVYLGRADPDYQLNLSNDVTLFNGRLSLHATVAYQSGMTQYNEGACASGGLALVPNAPNTPLATQAAYAASGCSSNSVIYPALTQIGLVQKVSTLRFNSASINFTAPTALARMFRAPHMTLALQGSNLGLHSNYRGKDPNVNAFSTVSAGDETKDLGQIPEPRSWSLRITVGN
jgi:hypothetical protein